MKMAKSVDQLDQYQLFSDTLLLTVMSVVFLPQKLKSASIGMWISHFANGMYSSFILEFVSAFLNFFPLSAHFFSTFSTNYA